MRRQAGGPPRLDPSRPELGHRLPSELRERVQQTHNDPGDLAADEGIDGGGIAGGGAVGWLKVEVRCGRGTGAMSAGGRRKGEAAAGKSGPVPRPRRQQRVLTGRAPVPPAQLPAARATAATSACVPKYPAWREQRGRISSPQHRDIAARCSVQLRILSPARRIAENLQCTW